MLEEGTVASFTSSQDGISKFRFIFNVRGCCVRIAAAAGLNILCVKTGIALLNIVGFGPTGLARSELID